MKTKILKYIEIVKIFIHCLTKILKQEKNHIPIELMVIKNNKEISYKIECSCGYNKK